MAWQHMFLRFTLHNRDLALTTQTCWVDGVKLSDLPLARELSKEMTLTALLNYFGKDGWQVASQNMIFKEKQNGLFTEETHYMTLKREV